jgi:hypothetical protein
VTTDLRAERLCQRGTQREETWCRLVQERAAGRHRDGGADHLAGSAARVQIDRDLLRQFLIHFETLALAPWPVERTERAVETLVAQNFDRQRVVEGWLAETGIGKFKKIDDQPAFDLLRHRRAEKEFAGAQALGGFLPAGEGEQTRSGVETQLRPGERGVQRCAPEVMAQRAAMGFQRALQ